MTRVVWLVTDLMRGGTPLRLLEQARAGATDCEIHVGCLAPPGPVSALLEQAGIPTFACGARGVRDLGALRQLERELRERNPAILHCTLTHANVAGRMVAGRLGIPVIGSTATIEKERHLHRWLEWLTINRDVAHTVGSDAVGAHVATCYGFPRQRIHVVPAPVIARENEATGSRPLDLPPGGFVVGWFGRFDPVKRLEWLLGAARKLGPNDRVVLVGDGAERAAIERQIVRFSLHDRVLLPGWQSDGDLHRWRDACDVIASPSLTEGMPNAVLQGMLAARPIVASDIPAHRELAAKSGAILLAETPDAFAAQILRLRDERSLGTALGQTGHDWVVRHLSPAASRAALTRLYQTVLDAC